MSLRAAALAAMGMWAGSTILLAEVRWFCRPRLVERLGPHQLRRTTVAEPTSWRDLLAPLAATIGDRLSRVLGVADALDRRLARAGWSNDASTFRLRQLGWSCASLGAGAALSAGLSLPPMLILLVVGGGPMLTFLVLEQQLSGACAAHQRRLSLELPVIAEQIAMLLGAGSSLGGALQRIASRGGGVAAEGLRVVCARAAQGVTTIEALHEWAALARVDELDRLVAVLALDDRGTDLGRLVTGESRAMRRDAHRALLADLERRSQQVWIPVTVATLIPGVVFLAIPFVQALQLFAAS